MLNSKKSKRAYFLLAGVMALTIGFSTASTVSADSDNSGPGNREDRGFRSSTFQRSFDDGFHRSTGFVPGFNPGFSTSFRSGFVSRVTPRFSTGFVSDFTPRVFAPRSFVSQRVITNRAFSQRTVTNRFVPQGFVTRSFVPRSFVPANTFAPRFNSFFTRY